MRTDLLARTTVLLAAVGLVGCGGETPEAEEAEEGEEGVTVEVDPTTVGTISGVVNFAGTPPAAEPIDMSEEPQCADAYSGEGPMTQDVVASSGRLANVFVRVTGVSGAPAPSGAVTLDQENCRYEPHVLGVRTGQDLRITNSDPLLHNINANPTQNRGFNISQPREGMESTQRFQVAEVMIPVRCDVHGWMSAYIGVVEHPYFAVSGSDGTFTISNVPAGDYTIEAWHERYGTMTANVTVAAQGTAEVGFDYSADMAGAHVPLGEPLVIRHGENGIEVTRGGTNGGAGR